MTPKQVAVLADAWWKAREKRLEADHKAAALKTLESVLKTDLMAALKKENVGAIGGKLVTVSYKEIEKPAVEDWAVLYTYIKKTGSFDLLHKRLTEKAVELRWEDGKTIPGVYKLKLGELTYTQIKT